MLKKLTLVFLLSTFSFLTYAQTGTLRGKVKDAVTKEDIIGANVVIEGTTIGGSTDINGAFQIERITPGTYNILITYVSYKTKKFEGLVIEADKVTTLDSEVEEDIEQLGDIVIVAERETNSEVSVIAAIKESEQVAVGVSGEQIAKSQDRDAAQVIRRIPGVSLIDNRFVMVRGLSQRYNSVMINDILTPSSEVDIKSFSFDLVPSNIIDRMFVYKSGAGELPGEFAGGIIKIYTKDAPEENFITVGVTGGYRIGTTLESVGQIKGGNLDFLGFDDGKRQLPSSFPAANYSGAAQFNSLSNTERANLANQLKTNWLADKVSVNPDLRFNFSIGRRFNAGRTVIGNLTSVNFSNTNQYQDISLTFWDYGSSVGDLVRETYKDKQITNNVRLGILHNWLFKFNSKNSLEFKNIFNQMTFSETTLRDGEDITGNNNLVRSFSYRYETRSIYSGQLVGKHKFGATERSNLTWTLGFSNTNRQEPDWRRLRTISAIGTNNPYSAVIPSQPSPQESGRFFSNLNESVFSLAVNFEQKLGKSESDEESAKIRFGIYTEQKNRSFEARFFGYGRVGITGNLETLPLDQIFAPSSVTGTTNSFTLNEGTNPDDKYLANNTLLAGYVSGFFPIGNRFSMAVGLRVESNLQEVESRLRTFNKVNVSNPVVSILPSLNMTFDITDRSLIRLAYTSTVNRPEFRELAPFNFFDFTINSNIAGNASLKTATIQNIDFRYEFYPSPSELISIGAFYKYFENPIENFSLTSGNSLSYTFINAQSATSYGLEAELRKSFVGLSNRKFIQNLSFVANASIIQSSINLGSSVTAVDQSGAVVKVAVDNQDKSRPMMNQSPYLVNAGLYYNDEDKGWQFSVLYNVFGRRIFIVGNNDNPTIYEMPRNILDLNISKTINKRLELKFGVQDILNNAVRLVQDSDRNSQITDRDRTIRSFQRGVYTTLGISYRF